MVTYTATASSNACDTTTVLYWTNTVTTSATTTVWPMWNNEYMTTTSTATTDRIWYRWQPVTAEEVWQAGWQPAPLTAEEVAEQARQARQREEESLRATEERVRIAREAEARAAELLKANLNESQAREFESEQAFTVISKDGERRYKVTRGWQHNVIKLDAHGKRLATLCAHPVHAVPESDNMLAQKLMLEHAEEEFLKIANERRLA